MSQYDSEEGDQDDDRDVKVYVKMSRAYRKAVPMTEPKWLQIDPPEDVGHVDYRATVVAVNRDAGRIRVELLSARPASDLERRLRGAAEQLHIPDNGGWPTLVEVRALLLEGAEVLALLSGNNSYLLKCQAENLARIAEQERELAEAKVTK